MILMMGRLFDKLELKRKIMVLRVLIIVAYALIITSGTYAYLQVGDSKNAMSGQGECAEGILYQGTEIYHTNLSVTDNYLEGAKGTIQLTKNSSCKLYTKAKIYIHIDSFLHTDPTNSSTTTYDSNMIVNYKIMNGNTNVATGNFTPVVGTDVELTTSDVTLTESGILYTVYLWVEQNDTLADRYFDNDEIVGYLYAYSTQTSTIR